MRHGQFLLAIAMLGCGRELPAKRSPETRQPIIEWAIAIKQQAVDDQGDFPELIPRFELNEGFILKFHDGPDFYTWVMAEDKIQGEGYRSGVGIYFGNFPDLSHVDKKSSTKIKGTLCSQEVDWWSATGRDTTNRWVQRDALIINYKHAKEFRTFRLHAWVWGPSEDEVTKLAQRLESLKFRVARER